MGCNREGKYTVMTRERGRYKLVGSLGNGGWK